MASTLIPEVFIPWNEHGIALGYYSLRGVVELLRKHADNPAAVRFIADMLE
jgi:hypothetical protein